MEDDITAMIDADLLADGEGQRPRQLPLAAA